MAMAKAKHVAHLGSYVIRPVLVEAKLLTEKHAGDAIYVATLAEELRNIEAKIAEMRFSATGRVPKFIVGWRQLDDRFWWRVARIQQRELPAMTFDFAHQRRSARCHARTAGGFVRSLGSGRGTKSHPTHRSFECIQAGPVFFSVVRSH